MEWVEVTGRTVSEATEAALGRLGILEADAEVVVLSEGRTGLFGRLREEARVKARVRPTEPRPKRTRRPRNRRPGETGGTAPNGKGERREGPRSQQEGRGARQSQGGDGGQRPDGDRRRNRRRSRSSAGGTQNGQRPSEDEGARTGPEATDREEHTVAHEIPLEEQADAAKEFVEGLLGTFGFEATVGTRLVDEDTVEVAADGEGLAVLIGPRGTTLAALQEVTRTAVQRRFPARTDRILVDVAGYRQRRVAALQRFTNQVAQEVQERQEERALEPMSPADRKVVHDAANEIEGVATRSEGEEPRRYVVITPG
jgi:spoIIIJ-associated protein